jgi:hypothetical protein
MRSECGNAPLPLVALLGNVRKSFDGCHRLEYNHDLRKRDQTTEADSQLNELKEFQFSPIDTEILGVPFQHRSSTSEHSNAIRSFE